MVRRCSDKMAKMLMVVFNLVFLVCGIIILAVCINGMSTIGNIKEIVKGLTGVSIVFLVVGVTICIISFLGCCGALQESSCMVTTFMFLLTVILIAEVAVGIVAFTKKDEIGGLAKDEALKSLNQTRTDETARHAWEDIQTSMKCCGAKGPSDYSDLGLTLSKTCCAKVVDTCSVGDAYTDGCVKKIVDYFSSHLYYVGLAAILIAFVEVTGIIFACCLRSAISEKYETV